MMTDRRPSTLGGEIRNTYSTAMIIATIVILIAISVTKIFEYKYEYINSAKTDISIISLNLAPALLFGDQDVANRFVESLSSNESIEFINIFDHQGNLYSSYTRPNISVINTEKYQVCGHDITDIWSSSACGQIIATDPINKGKYLGTINLHYSRARFYNEIFKAFLSLAAAFIVAYSIGLLYIKRRLRFVVDPIKNLTTTTQTISANRDYSIHLQSDGRIDETNRLTDSFNHMMDQINKRDIELESKVAARTIQLSEYAKEMEQTNEDLRNFMYIFHHDLRTPILTMTCYVEETAEIVDAMRALVGKYTPLMADEDKIALEMILGDETFISIESLRESVLSVKNMFQSVVNISQISEISVEIQEFDLAQFLQKIVDDNKELASKNEVLLQTLPCSTVLSTDANLLQRIISYLLDNAIRFSVQSMEKIVTVIGKETPENWVISIQDSGPGISDDEISHIFDLFRRGETSHKNEGMGLTYAKALARRINARITVQSKLGSGSVFFVSIPKPSPKETDDE